MCLPRACPAIVQPLPTAAVACRQGGEFPPVTAFAQRHRPCILRDARRWFERLRAYRVVKPHKAQCAAAEHCPLANALAYESRILGSQSGKHRASQRSAEVRKQALAYRAAEQRNRAASQALEVFYLLAEAEANRDFLWRSKTQTDAMLEEVRDLSRAGSASRRAPPNSGVSSWNC